jgi:ribosomal protein S8E
MRNSVAEIMKAGARREAERKEQKVRAARLKAQAPVSEGDSIMKESTVVGGGIAGPSERRAHATEGKVIFIEVQGLRKVYDQAVASGETVFLYEGHEVLTAYAKYLLEYLESEG